MKLTPDNHTSDEHNGERGRVPFAAALAGMVVFAQKHQSVSFPNPERLGCPPPKTLRTLIASGKLPGPELRSHLHSCSECFRSYRDALAAHRIQMDAQVESRWWEAFWDLLSLKQGWAFAGVLSVMLLFLTGWESMQQTQMSPPEKGHAAYALPATQDVTPAGVYQQSPEQQTSVAKACHDATHYSGRAVGAAKPKKANASRKASGIKLPDTERPETVTKIETATPLPLITPSRQLPEPTTSDASEGNKTGGPVDPQRPLERNHQRS